MPGCQPLVPLVVRVGSASNVAHVRVPGTLVAESVVVMLTGDATHEPPAVNGSQYLRSSRCSVIVTLATPLDASYASPEIWSSAPAPSSAALICALCSGLSPVDVSTVELGTTVSRLMPALVVEVLFPALSVAVP